MGTFNLTTPGVVASLMQTLPILRHLTNLGTWLTVLLNRGLAGKLNPAAVGVEPIVVSDDEDVKEESFGATPSTFGAEAVESSEDDLDLTSSSSDEEAAFDCPSRRLVTVPKAPDGHRLVQHSKWKTLHLMADGYQAVMMCGRRATDSHTLETLQVRWDTHVAMFVGRKVKGL